VITTYILVAVISVSLLAICVSLLGRLRTTMDRYMRVVLLYLTVHALHALVVRTIFGEETRLGTFAPYGLLYGPFLYHAYRLAAGNRLNIKRAAVHAVPYLVFLAGYLLWLAVPALFAGYERLFGMCLYGTLALSLFGYTIWALFFRPADNDIVGIRESRMLSTISMVVAFIAVLFLVVAYFNVVSGPFRSQFNGAIIFLCMLSVALCLFFHVLAKTVGRLPVTDESDTLQPVDAAVDSVQEDDEADQHPESGPYQKSGIAADQLDDYESSLRQMVELRQVYLDDGLTLASLAQQLKIPKHHLSQVFSLRIGKNFNTYINELRINHAIELMHTRPELSITEIFMASGFTAKASFNRYFKQFRGTTPTEYRSGIA